MPIVTAHRVQRERILAACRQTGVADAAGVDAGAWASTTSPRVLPGDRAGYVGGLHRGRLPALEIHQTADTWERQATSGGTITTEWIMRAHVPEPSLAEAEERARGMLLVALANLRADPYLTEGREQFDAVQAGPLGHSLAVRFTLFHTYDRATYETDGIIAPPPAPPASDPDPTDMAFVAAETVSGGRVVWYDPAAPGWRYASHLNPAHMGVSLGVTLGAIMAGATGSARMYGIMTDPAWSFPAPVTLWLGDAGNLLMSPPSTGFLREVARAIEPNRIIVEPEAPVVIL